jgi:hypothetical protein
MVGWALVVQVVRKQIVFYDTALKDVKFQYVMMLTIDRFDT